MTTTGGCVSTSSRSAHCAHKLAAGVVLLAIIAAEAVADPPPTGTEGAAPASGQVSESKDGFFSSLKQAFAEDTNREVVRGHFDTGSPPNTQRYYCLVDPKSGKREPNGVSGAPFKRHDGMTGIKNAAVTPLSCTDAEQKGLLVTADYVLIGRAAATATAAAAPTPAPPPPPVPSPAPPAPAPAAAAALTPPPTAAPPVTAAPVAVVAPSGAAASEVLATFKRFAAAANAHDRNGVAAVLLDSRDFLWAQSRGNSIWGYREALDALTQEWQGSWHLEPQLTELRIGTLTPESAILVTPLLFTEGPTTLALRWSGVFVKTKAGWLIGSVVVTPFNDWRPAAH
jgi:hypothetical protein